MTRVIFALLLICCSTISFGFTDSLTNKYKTTIDTLQTDSLKITPDSLKSASPDTIQIFEMQNFAKTSDNRIHKNQYQQKSYRTPVDFISGMPYGYKRYMGILGQPDELMLYGFGNSNLSYLENGIPINNRVSNTLNLNNFQSEYIDSLEVISPVRSFIYSAVNDPVLINFNTRNSIESIPYTRLRIFQGADEEGFVDAIFNAYIMDKVNLTFQVTNASLDSLVANDGYGAWQGAVRLRYLHSESLNLIGSFRLSKTQTRLWGGIDKLNADTLGISVYDLDEVDTKVVYPRTYKKNTRFHYDIRALFDLVPGFTSELAFYYQTDLDEFRQNENYTSIVDKIVAVKDDNETNISGIYFRQPLKYKSVGLDIISRFETTDYDIETLSLNDNVSTFSVGGILSYDISEKSHINAFSKYLISEDLSYFGFGGEINIKLSDEFRFYGGSSFSEKPYNIYEQNLLKDNSKKYSNIFTEAKLSYLSDSFNITGGVFFSKQTNTTVPFLGETDSTAATFITSYSLADFNSYGLNLNLLANFDLFEASINANYYSKQDDLKINPEYTIQAGIFYKDKLFDGNLDLKAGFQALFAGTKSGFIYDYRQSRAAYYKVNNNETSTLLPDSDSYFNLDLMITGKVQDRAIIYFMIENILSNDFYVVPFYPIRKNVLRFGVSWEFYN